MKELRQSFRRNGLQYTLIMRNEFVALYGVSGEYTEKLSAMKLILSTSGMISMVRGKQYQLMKFLAGIDPGPSMMSKKHWNIMIS